MNNYKKKSKTQFIIIIIVLIFFQFLIEINYLLNGPIILDDIPTTTSLTTTSVSPKPDDYTKTSTSAVTNIVSTSSTTKKVSSRDNTIIINDDRNIDVEFNNISVINFINTNNIPSISSDGKMITFNVTLDKPTDSYSFTVDMKNKNNFDIKVDNIISNVLTKTQSDYLKFTLSYDDGSIIKIGDIIKVGETKKLKFTVLYKDDVNPISDDVTANYQGQITFVQTE